MGTIRSTLLAPVYWTLFFIIDLSFLFIFTFTQSNGIDLNIVPAPGECLKIMLIYLCVGIVAGFAALLMSVTLKGLIQGKSRFNDILVLTVSITINCLVNIYDLSNAHHLPAFRYHLIAGVILVPPCVKIFMFICKAFTRNVFLTGVSLCVSVEIFWSIIRCFPKGAYWGTGMSFGSTLLVAVCVGGVVFSFLYFVSPLLVTRTKRSMVMLTVIICAVCIIYKKNVAESGIIEQSGPSNKQANVILIITDTIRADFLSSYGYAKETSSVLSGLAQESVVYKNAYSTASWTLPSVASILTGTYPGFHGGHRVESAGNIFSVNKLAEENVTIAEVLQQNGYTTAGITSCEFVTGKFGFDQGFDYFDDAISNYCFAFLSFGLLRFLDVFIPVRDYLWASGFYGHRIGKQINESAFRWLEYAAPREKPFFLLLHYFDAHHPYLPEGIGISDETIPLDIRRRYALNSPNYTVLENSIIYSVIKGKKGLLADEYALLTENYEREIQLTGKHIGEVFDTLKKLGFYDNSIIIMTSDHGESFGEHGQMLHGTSLYEETIKVPLMIKYPKKDGTTGSIDFPVSLTGIVPTILTYLGIQMPPDIQGVELNNSEGQKIISQNYSDPSWKYNQWTKRFAQDLISFRSGDYKYMKAFGGEDVLFHLTADPDEKHNIAGKNHLELSKIKKKLDGYIRDLQLADSSVCPIGVDKKTIQSLKSLGYMH